MEENDEFLDPPNQRRQREAAAQAQAQQGRGQQQQVDPAVAQVQNQTRTNANDIRVLLDRIRELEARPDQGPPAPPKISMPKITFSNSKGEDWLSFKRAFLNHRRAHRYDDWTSRVVLAACMRDAAAAAVLNVRVEGIPGIRVNFDDVIREYEARFLPASASALAQTKFESAVQMKGETVLSWHSRVRDLFERAYPNQRDQTVLVRRFALGLNRIAVRNRVLRGGMDNFDAALDLAQSEMAVEDTNRALAGAPHLMSQGSGTGPEPMEIGRVGVKKDQGKVAALGQARRWPRNPNQPRQKFQVSAHPRRVPRTPGTGKRRCYKCGQIGHYQATCKTKSKKKKTTGSKNYKKTHRQVVAAIGHTKGPDWTAMDDWDDQWSWGDVEDNQEDDRSDWDSPETWSLPGDDSEEDLEEVKAANMIASLTLHGFDEEPMDLTITRDF